MDKLIVTSTAFEQDGWIPNRNSGYGEDFSPEIHIDNIDEKAVSLVITLDDIDHPLFPNYNHWVAWNIPVVNIIPECLPKGAIIEKPLHVEQGLAYGAHCYKGPKPPLNSKHRYCFTVYAIDTTLNINSNANKEEVLKAMDTHILQTGTLQGKYQRKHKGE